MDLKRFQITRDLKVSVGSQGEKAVVYMWAARKGASLKLSKKEFTALAEKIHIVKNYLDSKKPRVTRNSNWKKY